MMLPVFSALARVGAFAIVVAAAQLGLPASASAYPVAAPGVSPTAELLIPVQDQEQWIQRRGWNKDGDFYNTDPGPRRQDWRRKHHRDGFGWDRDRWRDEYPRYHRRRPTVYFDLDLAPRRYVQPRYHVEPRRLYRVNRLPRVHVAWCFDRYRSYRASDNSFQPNHGQRRECRSPYY